MAALQVFHTPTGGWRTNAFGAKLQQLWRIRGGRTQLTNAGRNQLPGWNDFTISVPVIEQERGTAGRGVGRFHAAPRQTYLIYSENTMPGLQQLFEQFLPAIYHNNLQNIPDLGQPGAFPMPQAFKDALLMQLNMWETSIPEGV